MPPLNFAFACFFAAFSSPDSKMFAPTFRPSEGHPYFSRRKMEHPVIVITAKITNGIFFMCEFYDKIPSPDIYFMKYPFRDGSSFKNVSYNKNNAFNVKALLNPLR